MNSKRIQIALMHEFLMRDIDVHARPRRICVVFEEELSRVYVQGRPAITLARSQIRRYKTYLDSIGVSYRSRMTKLKTLAAMSSKERKQYCKKST